MCARWASPKLRSNEATGYLVDLIYAPFIVIVEKKERKKKESLALASARATRRCSNSGTQPSTLPSVRMQSMHRTGKTYTRTRMQSSATYMRIGRPVCRLLPLSHTTVPQRGSLPHISLSLSLLLPSSTTPRRSTVPGFVGHAVEPRRNLLLGLHQKVEKVANNVAVLVVEEGRGKT